jgi:hypothetical protein
VRSGRLISLLLVVATAAATSAASPDAGAPKPPPPESPERPDRPERDFQRMPGPPKEEGPIRRDERAEQVLQAAIKAQGGADSISGRQTIYVRSRIKNYDYPEPEMGTITVWFKRPFKIRQEVTYPHKKEIRAFDGERAWVDAGKGAMLLGPLMARMMERGIRELDSPLLYAEGNLTYLSVAKDPKGRMTQKLSWRYQGYARDIMVDIATNRVLVIGEFDTPAGAISRMKVFDDYRSVQGMMLPFHQETFRNDQRYSEADVIEAKFNSPIDDALFSFPGPDSSPESEKPATSPSPR